MGSNIPKINYEYLVSRQIDRISIKISNLQVGNEDDASTTSFLLLDMVMHLETLLAPHLTKEYYDKKKIIKGEINKYFKGELEQSLGIPSTKIQQLLKLLILIAHNSNILTVYSREHDEDLVEASETPEASEMEEVKDD